MGASLSKKFIQSQQKILEKEKEKILLRIGKLHKEDPLQDPEHTIDNAAVDTDVREQLDHESIEAQIKDLNKRLTLINQALRAIEKGSYGQCSRCKKSIPLARLKIVPEALLCVSCESRVRL